MLKLAELENYHKPKSSIFEIESNRGDRLEILHWSGSFSVLFTGSYNDFELINRTR